MQLYDVMVYYMIHTLAANNSVIFFAVSQVGDDDRLTVVKIPFVTKNVARSCGRPGSSHALSIAFVLDYASYSD